MKPKHWKWKFNCNEQKTVLSNGFKWANNNMIHVDIESHDYTEIMSQKSKNKVYGDFDYKHTINIVIQDYWNNCQDVWTVEFMSKSGTNNNIITTSYETAASWYWNK